MVLFGCLSKKKKRERKQPKLLGPVQNPFSPLSLGPPFPSSPRVGLTPAQFPGPARASPSLLTRAATHGRSPSSLPLPGWSHRSGVSSPFPRASSVFSSRRSGRSATDRGPPRHTLGFSLSRSHGPTGQHPSLLSLSRSSPAPG
jgi:hypothetical protein